jgi:predicted AAA+ superfamily ATPase
VFTELAKQTRPLLDTISFWRSGSGAEVDFVVRKENHLIAIEVKAASLKRPKVSRSLRSFVQAYQPDKVFVLNESLDDIMELEGVPVVFDKLIHAHTIFENV